MPSSDEADQGGDSSAAPARSTRRGTRMTDVARLAGVSAMTVSRALRNPDIVTPETLKRIREAIDQVGYLPNRMAGNLSSQHSNIVGLVVPSLRNSLFVETIQGVADVLDQDYDLMIADSGYSLKREEAAVIAFLSQRVCGIILHNTQHTLRVRRLVREAGIPCIETGNLVRKPIDMAVSFSNRDAAFAMTLHLLDRGYRRIGFVSLPLKDNDRAQERRRGYEEALADRGLPLDEDIILEADPGLKAGGKAFGELVDRKLGVDAVFLTGDILATGAVFEAARRGMKVPQDIAIAGSDDSEIQEHTQPSLTSIRFPRYEIGRRAADLLIARERRRFAGSAVLDLGFEIIQREST